MFLGEDIITGEDVLIAPEERRVHMQVVGSSGKGKSKFLEMMIQEDIKNRRGLCLIDPHGELYGSIVQWLTTHQLFGKRKIILFDPLEDKYSLGFNPLNLSAKKVSTAVDNMIKACATVWGGEDPDEKPLLSKCLTAVFYALIEKKLSLYEAIHLVDTSNPKIRQYLTHDLSHYVIKKVWDNFNKKSKSDFASDFMSTENRMTKFLMSDAIKTIIGQTTDTIDFFKIMEEGYILLVNLKAIDEMSLTNTRLMGHLIINEFYLNCLRRDPDKAKYNPYYLYIDECGRYITEDIGNILEEGRKFGLHLILAHQRLRQLAKVIGEDGYDAVMNGCQTKVVFGGLSYEDARILVDNLFINQINYQEWKDLLLKPTVVGYNRTWFQSYALGKGAALGSAVSKIAGKAKSKSKGKGEAIASRPNDLIWGNLSGEDLIHTLQDNLAEGESLSNATSESASEVTSQSESNGASEGLEPIIWDLPFKEYSLEEQKERATASIVRQPVQFAIMKLPGKDSVFIKIPDVEVPYAKERRIEEFKQKCYLSTQYIKARDAVEQAITDRQQQLEQEAERYLLDLQKDRSIDQQGQRTIDKNTAQADFGDDEPPPEVLAAIKKKKAKIKK